MDRNAETERLQRRAEEWAKKPFEISDVASLQDYWTADALLVPPDAPVVSGGPALFEYYEQALQLSGFHVEWTPTVVDLSSDGGLGYIVGRHVVTVDDPEGNRYESEGRDVSIWRKDDDGEWRWCVQIWNGEPTA